MDGEAIMINLVNGIYYSMDKVGGLIWDLIDAGNSIDQIVSAILLRYDTTREQAQSDLERLVSELFEEKLVMESNRDAISDRIPENTQQDKLPYESPKLNIYRDMGDLLALDPPVPGLEKLP
jgi:hypothetical protein